MEKVVVWRKTDLNCFTLEEPKTWKRKRHDEFFTNLFSVLMLLNVHISQPTLKKTTPGLTNVVGVYLFYRH